MKLSRTYPSFIAVPCSAGVYAWQELLHVYDVQGIDDDCRATLLSGPDDEFYWECADECEQNGYVVVDGARYLIEQDEDIWLYDSDYSYDDHMGGLILWCGDKDVFLQPGDDSNELYNELESAKSYQVPILLDPYFD